MFIYLLVYFFQANNVCKLLEQLNDKVGDAECNVSDIKELHTTIKNTSIKIEDYKESILSIEKKLESIKNETINVDGIIYNNFIFNLLF